jgi:hypothetical protein
MIKGLDLGLKMQGFGFRKAFEVQLFGLRVWSLGLGFRV